MKLATADPAAGADPVSGSWTDLLRDYGEVTARSFSQALLDGRGTIFIPAGKYPQTETWHVTRRVHLLADPGAVLLFPADVSGVRVEGSTTSGDGGDSGLSVLEGLTLQAQGQGAGMDGITLKAQATLRDCECDGFGRYGFYVQASTKDDPPTNANCWRIEDCRSNSNGKSGLTVLGSKGWGDTNAGRCEGFQAMGNTGWGIVDDSFLGNTYVACMTQGNGAGGYSAHGAINRSVFLGCYTEPAQASGNKISSPATQRGWLGER